MDDGVPVVFVLILMFFTALITGIIVSDSVRRTQLEEDKQLCNQMVQSKFNIAPEKAAYECIYMWGKK